jgi:hypothetical protein
MSDIVTDIEKYKKGWIGGLPETPCGHGSTLNATKSQREWIPKIIRKHKIKTISDIGAGDLNWFRLMNIPNSISINHYDVYPRHADVTKFDLLKEIPFESDMIMCLWVLNHFDFQSCKKAIDNIKSSGSKFLMMTDRPIWHHEQPPEIKMEYIEELKLNEKGDRIILCPL